VCFFRLLLSLVDCNRFAKLVCKTVCARRSNALASWDYRLDRDEVKTFVGTFSPIPSFGIFGQADLYGMVRGDSLIELDTSCFGKQSHGLGKKLTV
jgi:hypothetical protein